MNGSAMIREARREELGAVGELTAASYLADGLVREEYVASLLDAGARAAVGVLLVAVDGETGELIGTVSLFMPDAGRRWAEGASEDEAVIRMLGVAPAARRRGVGAALTLECVRRAAAMGCRQVRLSTSPLMTAAQALYERLGFQRDPDADWEPVPGVPLLAYRLTLQT